MSRVAIVTDSTACIPEALAEDLHIHWVPYYIHRGTEELRDLATIKSEAFFKWLSTATELPKTANPGPGDYLQVYKKLAAEGGREIVSIHMTSIGSGAYRAAMAAKEILGEALPEVRVEVVDSLNVAMCQGWMAVEAARAALQGASLADVLQLLRKMIPITRIIQTADTLKYLYMGGRIGRAKHLVASMLNIKPLISMEEGEIVALGTARTRSKAYRMMVEKLEEAVGSSRIKIAYMHAAAREEVEKLKEMVEVRLKVVESLVAELSPALGVHSGPGSVGFCYYPLFNAD